MENNAGGRKKIKHAPRFFLFPNHSNFLNQHKNNNNW